MPVFHVGTGIILEGRRLSPGANACLPDLELRRYGHRTLVVRPHLDGYLIQCGTEDKARQIAREINAGRAALGHVDRGLKVPEPGSVLRGLSPSEAQARAEALADAQRREREADLRRRGLIEAQET